MCTKLPTVQHGFYVLKIHGVSSKKDMMRIRAIQWSYSLVKHPAETKKIGEKSSQAFAREGSDSDMTLLCFVDTVCIFSRKKKIPSRPSFIGSNSELKQSKLFVSYSVLTKVNHQKVSHYYTTAI
jgi:hypothetical protein